MERKKKNVVISENQMSLNMIKDSLNHEYLRVREKSFNAFNQMK